MKMQRKDMTEEEMREFSEDVLPLLKQIKKIADANGVASGIRIWMSDGYMSLEGSGLCGWELCIHDGRPEMKFEKRVPLDVKSDEEVDSDGN